MIGPRYFVFLEFTDENVRELLDQLRQTLSDSNKGKASHVTVRGPYSTKPDKKSMEGWRDSLHGNGVLLRDIGIFSNQKSYVVYLSAKSKLFNDSLWWKPDFMGSKSKRKPHVTLLETDDKWMATTFADFLQSEDIEIFTYGIDLTVYTSKQYYLHGYNAEMKEGMRTRLPPERIVFRTGIFERIANLKKFLDEKTITDRSQGKLL